MLHLQLVLSLDQIVLSNHLRSTGHSMTLRLTFRLPWSSWQAVFDEGGTGFTWNGLLFLYLHRCLLASCWYFLVLCQKSIRACGIFIAFLIHFRLSPPRDTMLIQYYRSQMYSIAGNRWNIFATVIAQLFKSTWMDGVRLFSLCRWFRFTCSSLLFPVISSSSSSCRLQLQMKRLSSDSTSCIKYNKNVSMLREWWWKWKWKRKTLSSAIIGLQWLCNSEGGWLLLYVSLSRPLDAQWHRATLARCMRRIKWNNSLEYEVETIYFSSPLLSSPLSSTLSLVFFLSFFDRRCPSPHAWLADDSDSELHYIILVNYANWLCDLKL